MKLLAIDTSTEACSAALMIDGNVIERYRLAPREHARLILPMVDELMNESGLNVTALDALAFGRGPGAFTGLRIAAGVIQGIAFAADLPVVPVSSLAAMALGAYRETRASHILAAFDARIQEVYWGVFQCNPMGELRKIGEEMVCDPEYVPVPEGAEWYGVGSGWADYLPQLRQRLAGTLCGWEAQHYPRAREVAELATAAVGRGETVSAEHALPVYLRNQVAVKQSRIKRRGQL